jgi:hypothetical protein
MHHTPFRYDCGLCIAHATINLVGIARSVLCSPITCHVAKKYERNPGLSQVQEQATVRLLLFFLDFTCSVLATHAARDSVMFLRNLCTSL